MQGTVLSCKQISYSPLVIAEVRNNGGYDPIPYKDWMYIDCPRNEKERKPGAVDKIAQQQNRLSSIEKSERAKRDASDQAKRDARHAHVHLGTLSAQEMQQHLEPVANRTLRPRKLCILKSRGEFDVDDYRSSTTAGLYGFDVVDVAQWMKQNEETTHPDYLFVAYTANQFDTSANAQDANDAPMLRALAEQATRDAGLTAFWIAAYCLPGPNEEGIIEDLWRLSDVVRGAKQLAIVVGHPINERGNPVAQREMLLEFGSRMWTLPEVLLSKPGAPIRIYTRGLQNFEECDKSSIAVRIWDDAHHTRQLMDHYEGSVVLSVLELIVVALQCLNSRSIEEENLSIRGEMSYVLMGLMLQRPIVDLNDTAFQAFARLALANYSHMLLERMVCVMPTRPRQPWHDTKDHWGVQLYDIYPCCQVAGISDGDSVIIDGAYGATIRWDRFERVAYATQDSWGRFFANLALRFAPFMLIIGIPLAAIAFTVVIGAVFILLGLGIMGASPVLLRYLYTGKVWNTQAHFFAFEGYMDIQTIEAHIFGGYMKRMTWAPFASTLSINKPGAHSECIGEDPITNPETRRLVEGIYTAGPETRGQQRVFTLVDTFTMTVTLFLAENPPVSVIVCGAEGGMQRAMLCSYDSATNTFRRETVLRMETHVLNRMQRLSRFKFQFQPPVYQPRA